MQTVEERERERRERERKEQEPDLVMLFLVGLGLGNPKDITLNGLEAVQTAEHVYLESYTSILSDSVEVQRLEELFGRKVIQADREMVESDDNEIVEKSRSSEVVLLVVGDPLGATTHTDLILRCVRQNIPYRLIHNASIMNAVACCGLQLYSFGETVSIPFWDENWKPSSFVDKIISNKSRGLHTLCLLDIKVKEKSVEALIKGRDVYEKPRFMSVSVAASQLLQVVREDSLKEVTEETTCVGLARVGSPSQQIRCSSLENMAHVDLGPPLHTLIITGNLHPLEQEMLLFFS